VRGRGREDRDPRSWATASRRPARTPRALTSFLGRVRGPDACRRTSRSWRLRPRLALVCQVLRTGLRAVAVEIPGIRRWDVITAPGCGVAAASGRTTAGRAVDLLRGSRAPRGALALPATSHPRPARGSAPPAAPSSWPGLARWTAYVETTTTVTCSRHPLSDPKTPPGLQSLRRRVYRGQRQQVLAAPSLRLGWLDWSPPLTAEVRGSERTGLGCFGAGAARPAAFVDRAARPACLAGTCRPGRPVHSRRTAARRPLRDPGAATSAGLHSYSAAARRGGRGRRGSPRPRGDSVLVRGGGLRPADRRAVRRWTSAYAGRPPSTARGRAHPAGRGGRPVRRLRRLTVRDGARSTSGVPGRAMVGSVHTAMMSRPRPGASAGRARRRPRRHRQAVGVRRPADRVAPSARALTRPRRRTRSRTGRAGRPRLDHPRQQVQRGQPAVRLAPAVGEQ